MSEQLSYGAIIWATDLSGVTTTTSYPSGASVGVELDQATSTNQGVGTRVHVKLRYQVASGTLSTDCHLYGYDGTDWYYLKSLNSGNSLAASTKWGASSTLITYAEAFEYGFNQFSRYATRVIAPQGVTVLITTAIGYERL